MAILHRKEEKIQVVLGRLPKQYTHDQFVEMFIKLYSKDWGKIKSAYIKQSQDKELGTVVNMPKPDLYLKQVLAAYLAKSPAKTEIIAETKTLENTVDKVKAPSKNTVKILSKVQPTNKTEAAAKQKAPVATIAEEPAKAKKKAAVKREIVVKEPLELAKEATKKAPLKKKKNTDDTSVKTKKSVKATEE